MDEETPSETTEHSSIVDRLLSVLPFLSFLLTLLLVRSLRRKRKTFITRYVPPSLYVAVSGQLKAPFAAETLLGEPSEEDKFGKPSGGISTPPGTQLIITVAPTATVDLKDRVDVDIRFSYRIGQTHHSKKIGSHSFGQLSTPSNPYVLYTTVPDEAADWDDVTVEAVGKAYHNQGQFEEGTGSQPINTKPF